MSREDPEKELSNSVPEETGKDGQKGRVDEQHLVFETPEDVPDADSTAMEATVEADHKDAETLEAGHSEQDMEPQALDSGVSKTASEISRLAPNLAAQPQLSDSFKSAALGDGLLADLELLNISGALAGMHIDIGDAALGIEDSASASEQEPDPDEVPLVESDQAYEGLDADEISDAEPLGAIDVMFSMLGGDKEVIQLDLEGKDIERWQYDRDMRAQLAARAEGLEDKPKASLPGDITKVAAAAAIGMAAASALTDKLRNGSLMQGSRDVAAEQRAAPNSLIQVSRGRDLDTIHLSNNNGRQLQAFHDSLQRYESQTRLLKAGIEINRLNDVARFTQNHTMTMVGSGLARSEMLMQGGVSAEAAGAVYMQLAADNPDAHPKEVDMSHAAFLTTWPGMPELQQQAAEMANFDLASLLPKPSEPQEPAPQPEEWVPQGPAPGPMFG